MRLLVLAGVSAMLWGQQRPVVSARRILTEAEENYCTCAMPSLDAEALVRVDRRGALEQSTDQFRIAAYFLPSDKIRVDRKAENWRIELNNGAEMAQFGAGNYHYRAKAPQVWTEALRPDEFPGTHWLIYDALTAGARNIRLKGEETLRVDGKPVACYVIEFDRDLRYRSGTIAGKTTVWIGKREKYVFKEISSRGPMPAGDPGDGRIDRLSSVRTVTLTRLNVAAPPAESMFDIDAVARNLPREPEAAVMTVRPGDVVSDTPAVAPPGDSKARRILAEVATAYNALRSYQGRHVAVYAASGAQGRTTVRMPMEVTYLRPGKWRIAFAQTGDVWIQDRAETDGFWQFWPSRNLYWRSTFRQFLRPGEMLYEDLADRVVAARVLPEETVMVGGRAVRCTVVEARYDGALHTLQHETVYTSGGTYKLWIDMGRKLVVRWQNGLVTESLEKVELNPAVGEGEFVFQAPAGAKEYKPF